MDAPMLGDRVSTGSIMDAGTIAGGVGPHLLFSTSAITRPQCDFIHLALVLAFHCLPASTHNY